ncbi:MAG: cupredoxin domain-containing protein [Methanoculleus sp.]
MRPNIILLVALITVSAGVLAAGCVTPGENVTQPTTAPAATATPAITETATPLETATSPATEMTTAETPSTTTVAATTTTVAATTTPTVTNTTTPAATTTTVAAGGTATVDLSAKNIAFNKSTITVPAGADVTVNFDNEDDGIPHNFAVYTDSSATDTIFSGETITGPDTTTYTFTAPSDPGTYYFRCDVHPEQMNGDFVVQ